MTESSPSSLAGNSSICIAVDCMGGDYAPGEIVRGAILGAQNHGVSLKLVGDPDAINAELKQINCDGVNYEIVEASETIDMDESPTAVIRKKRNASVVVGCKCVSDGEAQGLVAVGNTGAAMTAAIFNIGRIKGIDRPAIGVVLPSTTDRPTLLLDAGANADCIPDMLLQFARMGSIFSELVFGITEPRVGLLNIGEESSKGNSFSLSCHKLLEQQDEINFVGNIEGRHLFDGSADVVVCDGFTGNVALKTAEGVGKMVMEYFRTNLTKRSLKIKAGAFLVKPILQGLKRKVVDEEFGGAVLLGIKGICIVGHGGSKANAIQNAIRVAKTTIQQGVIQRIEHKVLEGII